MKRTKKIKIVEHKPLPPELISSFAECVKAKWNEKLYEAFEIERNKYLGEFKNDRLEQAKLVVELSRLPAGTKNAKQSDKNYKKAKEKEEGKKEELASGPCALQESRTDERQEERPVAETLPEVETKEIG